MKIIVLGATGLLGSEVFAKLGTLNQQQLLGTSSRQIQGFLKFDVLTDQISQFLYKHTPTHIINCIGLVPQKIHNTNLLDYSHKMVEINSIFPRKLSTFAALSNTQLIQIRTDCVFYGKTGNYKESSFRLPNSIYGASKLFGEVSRVNQHHIRASIVGHKPEDSVSLFGWFRNLPIGAVVDGYTNHHWNGITTSVFARLSAGLIQMGRNNSTLAHLVPAGSLSKYEMLLIFQSLLNRNDIQVNPSQTKRRVDRRLTTNDEKSNRYLWELAGYSSIPNVQKMLEIELSEQLIKYR